MKQETRDRVPGAIPHWATIATFLPRGIGFPGTCEVLFTWNPPSGALYFPEDWEFSLLGGNPVLSIEHAASIKHKLSTESHVYMKKSEPPRN